MCFPHWTALKVWWPAAHPGTLANKMDEALRKSIADQFRNTPLEFLRINKNLVITHFSDVETEKHLRKIILSTPQHAIERKGKNYYFKCPEHNAILTVNAYAFTIITAKKNNKI